MTASSLKIADWLAAFNITSSREELIFIARLAEHAERYNDMVTAVKCVTEKHHNLTIEERNLLSIAYKGIIGPCRSSWRVISAIEIKAEGDEKRLAMAAAFRQQVETEMQHICKEVLSLLEQRLINNASSSESRVFYFKMQGDYLRYLAEVSTGEMRRLAVEACENAYRRAGECVDALALVNPIRLGLALNYAVFFYEIKNEIDKACLVAQEAFDKGKSGGLEHLSDETYKDATLIMQLLSDNLMLWASEIDGGEDSASANQAPK